MARARRFLVPAAWKLAVPAAGLLGCIPCYLAARGYGIWLWYTWPLPILALAGIGLVVASLGNLPVRTKLLAAIPLVLIFDGASLAGWGLGFLWREARCRDICARCEPLIAALEAYRADRGEYPASLAAVPGWEERAAAAEVRVVEGRFTKHGIDVGCTDEADAVFYLHRRGYLCLVPIEHRFITSITRFHAYARGDGETAWRRERIIWTLTAAR